MINNFLENNGGCVSRFCSNLYELFFWKYSHLKWQKMQFMKHTFGDELTLERSIDQDTLNWETDTSAKLSWVDILKYSLSLFILCPLVCFYINYRFFISDVR
jgi:hypothetical protein